MWGIDKAGGGLRIVTAIEKTIKIQGDIDKIYPQVEKEAIEFEN